MRISSISFGILCFVAMFAGGCATILDGGGDQKLSIQSKPIDATVSIFQTNSNKNVLISKNQTPAIVKLNTGAGYFKAAKYHVIVEKTGYKTTEFDVQTTVRGWYFGNILFGGLIGMVIVDPLTGAMFKFAPEVIENDLVSAQALGDSKDPALYVVLKNELTPEQISHLLPLE